MKIIVSSIALAAALSSLAVLWTGCSLIGLAMDTSNPPDTLVASVGDKSLEGRSVTIIMRDGYSFAGECRKVGLLPAELYRSRYAQWQKRNGLSLFLPGDTLIIGWEGGQITHGSFEGFAQNSVILRLYQKTPVVRLRTPDLLTIPAEKVDFVRRLAGPIINGAAVRSLLAQEGIPTTGGLLVRRGDTSAWVPVDDIAEIHEIRYTYDWFYKGAVADAVGLAAAIVFFVVRK